jgi:F-type H+-transporting ATPase subunit b
MISSLFFAVTSAAVETASSDNLVADIATQFGVDWPKLISQIIVFSVIAFVLKKYAFGPIEEILEKRRKTIADSLSNAEKIKTELAAAEATRKEILTKANEQAAGLIADAQKAASIQIQKAAQDAIATAEDIIKKANEATKLEREREFAKLKSEVSALVSELTTKVIGRTLTDADKTRLNEEVLTQVGRN